MFLFLSAQDIKSLEVGLLNSEGRLLSFQTVQTSPEKYLSVISVFFKESAVSLDLLTGIIVVSGPGSFTSTRISVTLANALAFAKNLPIVGVENDQRKNGEDLIREFSQDWIKQSTIGFVTPVYDRPPHITLKNSGVEGKNVNM